MSLSRTHARLLVVAVTCTAIGAGASAMASAGAAGSAPRVHARVAGTRARALRRFAGRAVQGSLVVHTSRGGFVSVSFRRGTVDSVSGQNLTLTEGTRTASYKTVTVTIPSTAKVRDNRQLTTLSVVRPGQRVLVLSAPRHTFVIAHTAKAG